MGISLYEATVERFLQGLGGLAGVLEKSQAHFAESNSDLSQIVETRLWSDMLPFNYQVVAAAHHSLGAVEGVRQGVFSPPDREARSYPELQVLVAQTLAKLQSITASEVNAMEGRNVVFKVGEREIPYVAEGFLLSFSLPNFYFHATTAYDILRFKGVPLNKRDYIGKPRIST